MFSVSAIIVTFSSVYASFVLKDNSIREMAYTDMLFSYLNFLPFSSVTAASRVYSPDLLKLILPPLSVRLPAAYLVYSLPFTVHTMPVPETLDISIFVLVYVYSGISKLGVSDGYIVIGSELNVYSFPYSSVTTAFSEYAPLLLNLTVPPVFASVPAA